MKKYLFFIVFWLLTVSLTQAHEDNNCSQDLEGNVKFVDRIIKFHPWDQKGLTFQFLITFVYNIDDDKPRVQIKNITPYGIVKVKAPESFNIVNVNADDKKVFKIFVNKNSGVEIKDKIDFSQKQVNESLVFNNNKISFNLDVKFYFLIDLTDPQSPNSLKQSHQFFVLQDCCIDVDTSTKKE